MRVLRSSSPSPTSRGRTGSPPAAANSCSTETSSARRCLVMRAPGWVRSPLADARMTVRTTRSPPGVSVNVNWRRLVGSSARSISPAATSRSHSRLALVRCRSGASASSPSETDPRLAMTTRARTCVRSADVLHGGDGLRAQCHQHPARGQHGVGFLVPDAAAARRRGVRSSSAESSPQPLRTRNSCDDRRLLRVDRSGGALD